MSSLSCKNVKIQDSSGTVVSTLSYDGTNITIDKPVLAPTAAAGTNNTQLATTAMVHSAITNDLHATGSAPMYACRAWANFDGTQSTPTIRASGNVSSITKSQAGIYVMNFLAAMPSANYSLNGTTSIITSGGYSSAVRGTQGVRGTTSCGVEAWNAGGAVDSSDMSVAIFI
jgi:hypothetical protein